MRRLSQDDVARLAGIDQALVSRAERGVRISSRTRAAIAAALDVSEAELFGRNPEPGPGGEQ